jgi:hypothetical protein
VPVGWAAAANKQGATTVSRTIQTIAIALLLIATRSIASTDNANTKPNRLLHLNISTDHADGSYAAGEPVTWTIKLTAPKRLVLMPFDEHTDPHTAYKAVQNAWWKAVAAGEPLPMK